MKIFFRQFASLMASDGPIAAPSAEKSRPGRAIFIFLSLLLGLSGCGGGVTLEGPSRLPREVSPGAPVSAAVVNQFPSHVSGGGSLRVFSVYSQGGYAYKVNQNLQIGLNANYEYTDFDFSGLNFVVRQPWNHVHSFGGSFSAIYTISDKWGVMVVPILQAAGENGADWGRALIYGGAAAAIYSFDKDRTIGIGIGALNNLEQVSAFPFVTLNWKINDWLRLATPYRAGPAGPGGVELTFYPLQPNKDLRIGLGGSYLTKRFRLSEGNQVANGIGEYDTIPLFARLSYRVLPIVDLNLYGGASVYNYIRLEDPKGGRLFHSHQNVAPFIGIGLSLNLEKYKGGGG